MFLSLSDRRYLVALNTYRRVLHQRNSAIRSASQPVDNWNEPLVASAASIIQTRHAFFQTCSHQLRDVYQGIYEKMAHFGITYQTTIGNLPREAPTKETIMQLFSEKLHRDRFRENLYRSTVSGPHRDDFIFEHDGNALRGFASQGQCRTATLVLRLIMARYIARISHEAPVVMLDDILLDLDEDAQERFWKHIGDTQVLIATTRMGRLRDTLPEGGMLHTIEDGKRLSSTDW